MKYTYFASHLLLNQALAWRGSAAASRSLYAGAESLGLCSEIALFLSPGMGCDWNARNPQGFLNISDFDTGAWNTYETFSSSVSLQLNAGHQDLTLCFATAGWVGVSNITLTSEAGDVTTIDASSFSDVKGNIKSIDGGVGFINDGDELSYSNIDAGSGGKFMVEYNLSRKKSACANPVCGNDDTTYASETDAQNAGACVLNCGQCGACSTEQDISVYRNTTGLMGLPSLTNITTGCSFAVLKAMNMTGVQLPPNPLLARVPACPMGPAYMPCLQGVNSQCLGYAGVHFTEACDSCWFESTVCTIEKCLTQGPCAEFVAYSANPRAPPPPGLDPQACAKCEVTSGCDAAFIACAGANRRNTGIMTDIQRPDDQICSAKLCA